jgi:phosphonate transport system substrate-binding protein
VAPEKAARIRSLLLNLLPSDTVALDGEVRAVLKSAAVDGFVPIEDSDFNRVREMAKKTKMPPYQEF